MCRLLSVALAVALLGFVSAGGGHGEYEQSDSVIPESTERPIPSPKSPMQSPIQDKKKKVKPAADEKKKPKQEQTKQKLHDKPAYGGEKQTKKPTPKPSSDASVLCAEMNGAGYYAIAGQCETFVYCDTDQSALILKCAGKYVWDDGAKMCNARRFVNGPCGAPAADPVSKPYLKPEQKPHQDKPKQEKKPGYGKQEKPKQQDQKPLVTKATTLKPTSKSTASYTPALDTAETSKMTKKPTTIKPKPTQAAPTHKSKPTHAPTTHKPKPTTAPKSKPTPKPKPTKAPTTSKPASDVPVETIATSAAPLPEKPPMKQHKKPQAPLISQVVTVDTSANINSIHVG